MGKFRTHINSEKSHCICFGKLYKSNFSPMRLGSDFIDWTYQLNYLGVKICAGKTLSFDISPNRQTFFSASNCICASAKFNEQIVHLSLQETYCKTILTYVWYRGDAFDSRAAEDFE
jgi:hypothetical protein